MTKLALMIATISLTIACGDTGGESPGGSDNPVNNPAASDNNVTSQNEETGRLFEHADEHLAPAFLAQLAKPEPGALPCREREFFIVSDINAAQTEEPSEVYNLEWEDGRVASKIGDSFSYFYRYNREGQVIERKEQGSSSTAVYRFTYDGQGRTVSEVAPSYTVTYEYSGDTRLQTITTEDTVEEFEQRIEYDEAGHIVRVEYEIDGSKNVQTYVYVDDKLVLNRAENDEGVSITKAFEYHNGIEVGRQDTVLSPDLDPIYSFYVREFSSCPTTSEENNTQPEDATPSWFTGRYPGPCRIEHYTGAVYGVDVATTMQVRPVGQALIMRWREDIPPVGDELARVEYSNFSDYFVTGSRLLSLAWQPDLNRSATIEFEQEYNGPQISQRRREDGTIFDFQHSNDDNYPDGWSASRNGTLIENASISYATFTEGGFRMDERRDADLDGQTDLQRREEYDESGRLRYSDLHYEGTRVKQGFFSYREGGSIESAEVITGSQFEQVTHRIYTHDTHGNPIYSWVKQSSLEVYRYDCYDYGVKPW